MINEEPYLVRILRSQGTCPGQDGTTQRRYALPLGVTKCEATVKLSSGTTVFPPPREVGQTAPALETTQVILNKTTLLLKRSAY